MPYKLKHKSTGLYWKGGGTVPFTDAGLNSFCWSKNGKSWNLKQHLSSAISNTFHKEYIRTKTSDFYNLAPCEETYKRFSEECEIEYFQDAISIPFAEFRKDVREPTKKVCLKLKNNWNNVYILFGTHINLDKFLFYMVSKTEGVEYYPKAKYANYRRRMKL